MIYWLIIILSCSLIYITKRISYIKGYKRGVTDERMSVASKYLEEINRIDDNYYKWITLHFRYDRLYSKIKNKIKNGG